MEFDPENVKALCTSCHLYWWHKNPIEAHEWLKTVISKERYDRLRLSSNVTKQVFDVKLHKIFLEREIEKLKKKECKS